MEAKRISTAPESVGREAGDAVAVEAVLTDVGAAGKGTGVETGAGIVAEALQGIQQVAGNLVILGVFDSIGGGNNIILVEAIEGATVNPVGHVAAAGDLGGEECLLQVEFYHDAAVAVDVALVADEVAHGVDHQLGVAVVVGDGVEGEVLHHVGVAADDGVAAVVEQPAGRRFLLGIGLDSVFDAPMDEGDDEVDILLAGHSKIARHLGGVDEVDHVGRHHVDAVGAVGVGEQGETETVALDDEGMLVVVLGAVAVGAEVGDAEGVEYAEGAFKAGTAAVHAVVVGGGHDVEARLLGRQGQLARRGELRIARVGRSGEGHLEVEDGQVSTLHIVFHEAEAG